MPDFLVIENMDPLWSVYIQKADHYDFYHTSDYHRGESEARLFVAEEGEEFIALPLLIRPVPGSDCADATSVYGYAGPVGHMQESSSTLRDFFWSGLKRYFQENKIVTVFSRLHPLIDQQKYFPEGMPVDFSNTTLAVDLRLPEAEQRRQMRKSTKHEIKQLLKNGFTVRETEEEADIRKFVPVYLETMDRVGAAPQYYFQEDYFLDLFKSKDFRSKLVLVEYEGEIAAGAIFIFSRSIMQYHLAGTGGSYMKNTPMKLILDHARTMGVALGLSYLHLGGGVNGSSSDSLFLFKSGFTRERFDFRVLRWVVDEEAYELLNSRCSAQPSASGFFPRYREGLLFPDSK